MMDNMATSQGFPAAVCRQLPSSFRPLESAKIISLLCFSLLFLKQEIEKMCLSCIHIKILIICYIIDYIILLFNTSISIITM